jgi:hypothetical protein
VLLSQGNGSVPENVQAQVEVLDDEVGKALSDISDARVEMRGITDELKALTNGLEDHEAVARSFFASAVDSLHTPEPGMPVGPFLMGLHGLSQDVRGDIRAAEARFDFLAGRIGVNQGIIDRNRAALGRWSQVWPG